MKLEDIILSKISQSQKDKYSIILLRYEVSKVLKFIETESRMVVAKDSGKGEKGSC